MKRIKHIGFTLIELMIVLVIIGVFASVAIPGIMEVRHRNVLIDLVNNVQQVATQARAVAMQTRRAAEVAVTHSGADTLLHTNSLDGASCVGTQVAQANLYDSPVNVSTQRYQVAGTTLASIEYLIWTGTVCETGTEKVNPANPFVICYTGRGDLRIGVGTRSADPETIAWYTPCSRRTPHAVILPTGLGTISMTDGAVFVFNRTDPGGAANVYVDINRNLFLPTNGSAFHEVAVE